jgi:hypothetical protein
MRESRIIDARMSLLSEEVTARVVQLDVASPAQRNPRQLNRRPPSVIRSQMEGARTATAGPTKRRSDEDTPPCSPKRVKVDVQSNMGANSNSNADIPQDNKKPRKRRDAAGYAKSRQGKEKDGKNVGRRRRHGDGPDTNRVEVGAEADSPDVSEKAPRLPKRQSAILLGFCGTGCAGMQMSVQRLSFR